MQDSVPPANMMSASSRWMILKASPMALEPVAHAVATQVLGPLSPKAIEIAPGAIFTMTVSREPNQGLRRTSVPVYRTRR